ncbi:uncharacterized protein LOC123911315 [Trifolium pratense]|uniref:uncharacterized protein LOC123911315 n=1 Tax=Trifolium pratense TaxID=57577 RepID=UPI001E69006A|nr:uncharacterized protein LOC123911315 [Trifolium pratense]
MAECEAPSFSLGFDLDLHNTPPNSPNHNITNLIVPDSESDHETRPDPHRRIFKRLRQGLPSPSVQHRTEPPSFIDAAEDHDDDDIEEFSSQDEPVQVSAPSSVRNRSVCSSSKVSLKGVGVLIPHSYTNPRKKTRKQDLEVPASVGLETSQSGTVFRKTAASPLRKFQLIDSDDDDDIVGEDVNCGNKPSPSTSMGPMCNRNTPVASFEQNNKTQVDDLNRNQEDLWKNLSPVKNFSIPMDIQASAGLKTEQSESVFPNPKLEASPLRKFQLIDSDDDDDVIVIGENKLGPSSSTGNQATRLSSLKQDRKVQFVDVNQNQKHLSPVKNFSIPTPAFNDVCEEYFRSANNTQVPKSNNNETHHGVNSECQTDEQVWEAAGPLPPAHHYYFHDDPRVQELVLSRLCNFSLLGVNRLDQQQNIDYMGQFDSGGSTSRRSKSKNLNGSEGWVDPKIISSSSSRKKATKRNSTKSSAKKSKKNETSKLNSSDASANWVEPKDAGQRRVHASDQSTGHWYTGSDGRKVYVDKNGKESTGRSAYRLYRKESGATFKKSKKKTSAKKGKN